MSTDTYTTFETHEFDSDEFRDFINTVDISDVEICNVYVT